MRRYKVILTSVFVLVAVLCIPYASAHEVYVLSRSEVADALTAPRPDLLHALSENRAIFITISFLALVAFAFVLWISRARFLETRFASFFARLKHSAPTIMQITLGLALLASSFYGAVFGLELPFSEVYGGAADVFRALFAGMGLAMLCGIFPRFVGALALLSFTPLVLQYGFYMMNYGTYFGEALALALFGGGYAFTTVDINRFTIEKQIDALAHKYKFLLLRIVFGASLIYASLYAKFFHGALALETVQKFHLTRVFPFDPTFVVLGAMITEIAIGLLFLLGVEVRFSAIVLLCFLSASLWFFGEAVWPHIILIGTTLAMFAHGYDRYTVMARLGKRDDLEPVL